MTKAQLGNLVVVGVLIASPAIARSATWPDLDAGQTSASQAWNGRPGTLQVMGTFAGSPTVTLEWSSGLEVSGALGWEQVDAASCTFTAAGTCNFERGEGSLRIVVTGGTGADIVSARASPRARNSVGTWAPSILARYDFRGVYYLEDAQVASYGVFEQVPDTHLDSSGNANHLSLQGWNPVGLMTRRTDLFKQGAASLEWESGTKDHLYAWDGGAGHDTGFPGVSSGAFSIGFWIYPLIDTADLRVTYLHSDSSVPTPFDIIVVGTGATQRIFFTVLDGAAATQFVNTANGSISINTWAHVVCVWDGTELRVYIDGVQDPTTDACTSISNNTTDPELKVGFNIGSDGLVGLLDELWYVAGTVSAADIATIYSSGLS